MQNARASILQPKCPCNIGNNPCGGTSSKLMIASNTAVEHVYGDSIEVVAVFREAYKVHGSGLCGLLVTTAHSVIVEDANGNFVEDANGNLEAIDGFAKMVSPAPVFCVNVSIKINSLFHAALVDAVDTMHES
jgi:hypothetical protein